MINKNSELRGAGVPGAPHLGARQAHGHGVPPRVRAVRHRHLEGIHLALRRRRHLFDELLLPPGGARVVAHARREVVGAAEQQPLAVRELGDVLDHLAGTAHGGVVGVIQRDAQRERHLVRPQRLRSVACVVVPGARRANSQKMLDDEEEKTQG